MRVELAGTASTDQWTKQWGETVAFQKSRNRVVLLDMKAGFSLHWALGGFGIGSI